MSACNLPLEQEMPTPAGKKTHENKIRKFKLPAQAIGFITELQTFHRIISEAVLHEGRLTKYEWAGDTANSNNVALLLNEHKTKTCGKFSKVTHFFSSYCTSPNGVLTFPLTVGTVNSSSSLAINGSIMCSTILKSRKLSLEITVRKLAKTETLLINPAITRFSETAD